MAILGISMDPFCTRNPIHSKTRQSYLTVALYFGSLLKFETVFYILNRDGTDESEDSAYHWLLRWWNLKCSRAIIPS
jgi:hypothetical protein